MPTVPVNIRFRRRNGDFAPAARCSRRRAEFCYVGDDRLGFHVTRCRYAEFYKELGLADLGYLVHCNRDHAMIDGFNPDLKLSRTQTVMEGASHCDFRFTKKT